MRLGTEVGLGIGDILLDGTQLTRKGGGAQHPPIFANALWSKG